MDQFFRTIGMPASDPRVIVSVFATSGLLALFGYMLRRRGINILYQPATYSSVAWGLFGLYRGLFQQMSAAGMEDAFQAELGWIGPVLLVLTVVGYGAPMASLWARRREIAEWVAKIE